ncbi:MAG: toll/interleukin-1 receptor domain-containing protein [Comamonadaceae bacterium]|nr:toll/interleukin-1 receptor domain-containing protein [Comamonadaceae bacterium]
MPHLTDERCGTRVADVFISYKREDRPVVERRSGRVAAARLRGLVGLRAADRRELPPGDPRGDRPVPRGRRRSGRRRRPRAASSSMEASYAQRLGRPCPVRC